LQTDFHFGGFGKINAELVQFMNEFYAETNIPLDPIYTAKMFYGLVEMAKAEEFEKGTKILAIHTGGLQGIKGMNHRLRNKGFQINYEEIIDSAFPNPRA
jgi:1-aminocyclopropane-1-carboxylate deaminase